MIKYSSIIFQDQVILSHISPMFLKPPLGRQPACALQPAHDEQECPEGQVPTRRIIPVRSRNSILRRMSSLLVFNSSANISIVLEWPSSNSFSSSFILFSCGRDTKGCVAGHRSAARQYVVSPICRNMDLAAKLGKTKI